MFPGNQHTYNSADNVVNEGVDNNNIYLMNSSIHLLSVEFHLQNLILRLVLLRNLTPKQGLCNGTRLAIINMTDNVIEARILCGDHAGELTFIPRRRQFPIDIAFAMTINKAQGQSIADFSLHILIIDTTMEATNNDNIIRSARGRKRVLKSE
nr:5519_t:CDS:2 [Entrophospora candida]